MNILQIYKDFILNIQNLMQDEYGQFIVLISLVLIFQFLDIVTGFSRAVITKKIESHAMSKGFIKKGNMLLVLLGVFSLGICIPKVGTFAIYFSMLYVIVNELISIAENLSNMDIKADFIDFITKRLAINNEDSDDSENKYEEEE